MSNRRNVIDIREMLNHIRARSSNWQIAQDMGVDRRTIQRYRQWAQEQGLLEASLPALGDLVALLDQMSIFAREWATCFRPSW